MADSNSTKSALADAMKKLMVCKSFAKISISDLCEGKRHTFHLQSN